MSVRAIHKAAVAALSTLFCLLALSAFGQSQEGGQTSCVGAIYTTAVDAATIRPLTGVTVQVEGTGHRGASDSSGALEVGGLPCGRYRVRFSHVGYETVTVSTTVTAGADAVVVAHLIETTARATDIVVTAARPYHNDTAITAHAVMTRHELETAPQIANDLYRAVSRLPGVEANDFSARFAVRGGDFDEVLVTLDGMELRRPFHIQDVDGGLISMVDIEAVDSVELITGAFPAQYGNRLSGVFNLTSRKPPESHYRLSATANLLDLRAMSEGVFAGRRGSWLLTARRGYAEYLAPAAVDSQYEVRPVYYDAFARLSYALSDRHKLTAHVLYGEDHFKFERERGVTADGRSQSLYGWLTIESTFGTRLSSTTLVSQAAWSHDRSGLSEALLWWSQFPMTDLGSTQQSGLRQSWVYAYNKGLQLRWGCELRYETADYDYERLYQLRYDWDDSGYAYYWVGRKTDTATASWISSGYFSGRLQIMQALTLESGIRCDHASHIGGTYLDPRVSILWRPAKRTVLRLGSGRYHQYQTVDALSVGDGELTFSPPEQTIHVVAGIDQNLGRGVGLRVEAYRKSYSRLRPRYQNGTNQFAVFPEAYEDRVRVDREHATARGLDVQVEKTSGRLGWRLCYALASATEHITGATMGRVFAWSSTDIPAPCDRRHKLTAEVNLRPSPSWHFGLAWRFNSGAPYTEMTVTTTWLWYPGTHAVRVPVVQPGALNDCRYPTYHRLDLRADRRWSTPVGEVTVFLELINLYGRENIRAATYELASTGPPDSRSWYLDRTDWYWMPFIPSIGFRWTWEG